MNDEGTNGTGRQSQSRRGFLAGLVGGSVAAMAARLAGPAEVAAVDGQSVLLGVNNTATKTTQIAATQSTAFIAKTSAPNGTGISGGVTALTGPGYGGHFSADSPDGIGLHAHAFGGSNALRAVSMASQTFPPISKKTGVHGYAAQDATAIGVFGESTAGLGVKGKATTGSGVYGTSQSGYGFVGFSSTGVAAYFSTSGALSGVALQTVGRVKFDKSVGLATVLAGTKSVIVTPGIDLTTTSAVVATLQGAAGGTLVTHVLVDATNNRFTIYLTKNATGAVKVAWHVFG